MFCFTRSVNVFSQYFTSKQGKNKPNDQSLLLGDAEILRWFLLPSEADAFLRKGTRDGYPKVPPFTPLRRCYHGAMKVLGEEHDNEEEDSKSEQKCTTDFNVKLEQMKEKLDTEIYIETEDKDICESETAKDSDGSELENEVVTNCSTENSPDIKRTDRVKFHNPPRHVFNLVVKVCGQNLELRLPVQVV